MRMEQGSRFQPHHIKIMKIALALAIIRNKPPGVSGEEQALRLSRKLSQLQTDWRERAGRLEIELLRTRQELISYQAESTQSTILTDSQWASSGYSSYSQGSSETFKHRSTVTWQGREVEHPADPSNHGDNQLDCEREASTENRIKERIRGHVKFCSSVSALVGLQGQLSDLVTFDLRANLHDTVVDAMKGLSESLECGVRITSSAMQDLFLSASKSIVDCLQLPLMAPVLSDLSEACCSLTSSLVECIVNKHSSPVLCHVLVVLCGVPEVLSHTVGSIVKEMVICADNLKCAIEDVECLDISRVEGIGDLASALEQVLEEHGTRALNDEECSQYVDALEVSVIQLIDIYPLYCYTVWRLIVHLDRGCS